MAKTSSSPTRRRVIGILAAAAGLPLLPHTASAGRGSELVEWRGPVMGAMARLLIHHHDRSEAQRIIDRALAEVARLEAVFSLYRQDSSLTQLNARSVLEAPPAELVDLLNECGEWHRLSGGAFDPTVQPLWRFYARHFAEADGRAPDQEAVTEALADIGFQNMLFNRDRIAFKRRGMALTLNGIAQGYITDRVVALLRAEGIGESFVDMGEGRAIGAMPDDQPWRVTIPDPDAPDRSLAQVMLVNRAIATSAGAGFRFDPAGRFNHLLDPRSGASASRYRSVTVIAPSATAADAFSTAGNLMSLAEIEAVVRLRPELEVRLVTGNNDMLTIAA